VTDAAPIPPIPARRARHISAPAPPRPGALRVTTRAHPAGTVITLAGDLDIATAALLTDHPWHRAAGPGPRLVADLSALTFCDGTGLSALLLLHCRAFDDYGWLRLAAASTVMHRLLRITGLDPVLRAFPGIDEAFTAPAFAVQAHDAAAPGTAPPPARCRTPTRNDLPW